MCLNTGSCLEDVTNEHEQKYKMEVKKPLTIPFVTIYFPFSFLSLLTKEQIVCYSLEKCDYSIASFSLDCNSVIFTGKVLHY